MGILNMGSAAADRSGRKLNWTASLAGSAAVCVLLFLLLSPGCGSRQADALVVYCAHDAFFAEEILDRFEQETGIPVSIKFDTEATKSLGLTNQILAEREHPRCDVFWNNELLGTVSLQAAGVLEPYRGPGFARIPAEFKDPQGHWTGFAARLRVYIVNTDRMPATDEAIETRLSGDLSRFAVARPMFGTTLTHYSALWREWGGSKLQAWHRETRARGLVEATGNAHVRDLVASGTCDFGWTDTDDYFGARDHQSPVAMLPVRLTDGSTIAIPNSVCIMRGTRRPEQARRLVDFLLSSEIELALSRSAARQIPLGTVDERTVTADVRQLRAWALEGYDLRQLPEARAACLAWLTSEFRP
jgi:iron(III) transport system substrate-binding protein